tara:strand:+ start:1804 stop:2469 length:666 start_codon:yes stop_codon:yes gene_type:complete
MANIGNLTMNNEIYLKHAFLGAFSDLALYPMKVGQLKKLSHFQMPIKAFHILCKDIYARLSLFEYKGIVGNFYIQSDTTDSFVDIIFGKKEHIDAWYSLWKDLYNESITLNKYHTEIGLLFGYSTDAIHKYLEDEYAMFPNQQVLDVIVMAALRGIDMFKSACNFVEITDKLHDTVEKSIVCNDIEDKMLMEMETEALFEGQKYNDVDIKFDAGKIVNDWI